MKWLNDQVTWIKSFFSERSGKGSMKRFLSFWIVMTFMYSYFRLLDKIAIENIPYITQLPDVPTNWMLLLASIIGFGILDKMVDKFNISGWFKDKVKKNIKESDDGK